MPREKKSFADGILDSNCDAESDTLGLLQTEHSGINFNPFVNASHTDAERHYFGKDHFTSGRMLGLTARWICESCRNLCSVLYWPHGRAILADWHSGL